MPAPSIPRGDVVALTRALVRVDSRNPALAPDGPGEGPCARLLADVLSDWGFAVELQEALPERPNVVARIGRREPGARSLLLNGHLDVVGVDGMRHAPFDGAERDGRLWGRGAADMKGGVAAMCAAALRAHDAGLLRGEAIVAAVADEEYRSAGTSALVAAGVRADAAIVTEPTRLAIMPAHKGFAWVDVEVRGRAAHGSRYEIGVDAVRHAGLVLAELDALDSEELPRRPEHPLLGRASLHAATGLSTYPERCAFTVERRMLPGESARGVVDEIEQACARVRARRPALDASVSLAFAQPPSDVAHDAPIVRALAEALGSAGMPAPVAGMSAWTDAALLNAAGVPAICFGPGDIALAHSAEEWVPVDELHRATDVLARLVTAWCAEPAARR
jgi:acetylornithine deacetylase